MNVRAARAATSLRDSPRVGDPLVDLEELAVIGRFDTVLGAALRRERHDRPFITLAFAQSVDGSIARASSSPTALSNARSLTVTHLLRTRHDAILVGIRTVLADDPLLTVRLVEGPSPQAIVLDSWLRFPLHARLLVDGVRPPIIATTTGASEASAEKLRAAGARILRVPPDAHGMVDLEALLLRLRRSGTRSLMVEGGARVITSVLRAEVADHLVLTIAPVFLGGLPAVNSLAPLDVGSLPQLRNILHTPLGDDLVLSASL